jgi:hypothetical protein
VLTDAGLRPSAVRGFEQDVHRAVELLFGRLDVPLLQLPLAGFERALRGRDERLDRIFDRQNRWWNG